MLEGVHSDSGPPHYRTVITTPTTNNNFASPLTCCVEIFCNTSPPPSGGISLAVLLGLFLIWTVMTSTSPGAKGGGGSLHENANFDYVVPVNEKPILDNRNYGFKQFPNGLRYLAIQDPDGGKAGISALISTGSLRDPDATPGLAHLLEHTVFTGGLCYFSAEL